MEYLIVYKSQTGFTKNYAEIMATEIGCKVIPFCEMTDAILSGCNAVIFGSRIHAGKVDGLKKAMGTFPKKHSEKYYSIRNGRNSKRC